MIVFHVFGDFGEDEPPYRVYSNGKKVSKLFRIGYDRLMRGVRKKGFFSNGNVIVRKMEVL